MELWLNTPSYTDSHAFLQMRSITDVRSPCIAFPALAKPVC